VVVRWLSASSVRAPGDEVSCGENWVQNAKAISVACGGQTGNGPSTVDGDGTFLSADGRFVVFQSQATNLCGALSDQNGAMNDIFVMNIAKSLPR
jgi:Tol biopolymer transport system component